jgi:hypothetical protein
MKHVYVKLNKGLPWKQQLKQDAFRQQIMLKFKGETIEFCTRNVALFSAETGTLRNVDQKYVENFEK